MTGFFALALIWGGGWAFWLGTVMDRLQFMHQKQRVPVVILATLAIAGLALWPFWLGQQHSQPVPPARRARRS